MVAFAGWMHLHVGCSRFTEPLDGPEAGAPADASRSNGSAEAGSVGGGDGGWDDASGPNVGPLTFDEFCRASQVGFDALAARCFGGEPEYYRQSSVASCSAERDVFQRWRLSFSPERAAECLRNIHAADVDERTACARLWALDPTCLMDATGEPGDECIGFSCREGSECEREDGCSPGVCVVLSSDAEAGKPCFAEYGEAACSDPQLICSFGWCGLREGASCLNTRLCAEGLYCDSETRVCLRFREWGEPCRADEDCNPLLRCFPDSSTCRAVRIGEACLAGSSVCAAGVASCAADGECREHPRVGQACDEALSCVVTGTCASDMRCGSLGLDGVPCIVDSDCVGQVCEAGTCSGTYTCL